MWRGDAEFDARADLENQSARPARREAREFEVEHEALEAWRRVDNRARRAVRRAVVDAAHANVDIVSADPGAHGVPGAPATIVSRLLGNWPSLI